MLCGVNRLVNKMIKMKHTRLLFIFGLILGFASCKSKPVHGNEYIEKVELALNGNNPVEGKSFKLDYSNSLDSGFVFPSVNQSNDGKLSVNIHVNKLDKNKKYFYKVYYQNESYKFDEKTEDGALVNENFYGSWENPSLGFLAVDQNIIKQGKGIINTKIRLIGNPRNEEKYISEETFVINEDSIAKLIANMKGTPEWCEKIAKKAKENNRKLDDQLRLDALWTLEAVYRENKHKAKVNLRWKRNLRLGNYSIMAVLIEESVLKEVPASVQFISKKENNSFYNPYKYFLADQNLLKLKSGEVKNSPVYKIQNAFTLKSSIDFTKGIYINDTDYLPNYNLSSFNKSCAKNGYLNKHAQIEQFFHGINKNATLNNIPLVTDIMQGYTKKDFDANAKKYTNNERIKIPIGVTDCPCKTVKVDTLNNTAIITNPAATKNNLRKENVGINTRNGFTYGKYTVKIKMAEQMNRNNVWNGLTNAIWLINRGGDDWNGRRICDNNGYIPKNEPDKNKRVKQLAYSEIDFEIVKCAQYWPKTSYKNSGDVKTEEANNAQNVMVTCTNWDLACSDVADYIVGAVVREFGSKKYELHRWDTWYKALTIKTPANEDELFASNYYYFQIEWKPKEIIWRIGPEKNNLREVGRMNDQVTQIPNNQMILAITQEYHLANWWPEAPFSQDDVPFPSKDLVGTVYSIEIE